MFIVTFTDQAGEKSASYGPFRSDLAARDWSLEAMELGVKNDCIASVTQLEEPIDLGFDPGL